MRLQFDAFTGDDEKAAAEAKRVLAEGFGRWLEGHPAIKAEPFDIELLLDWKYSYGDGHFGSWSRSDVDELLLEHLPRKLSATSAEAASIPVTLGAFVRYLEDTGLLAGGSDDADTIESMLGHLRPPSARSAGTPSASISRSRCCARRWPGSAPGWPSATPSGCRCVPQAVRT